MSREELNLYREHGWNYFSLHAEQRLKTFHFYIILSTLIYGAMFTVLKDLDSFIKVVPILLLQTFLSFIFWKLDQRNKELIKHGEGIIKLAEKSINNKGVETQDTFNLFLSEEKRSLNRKGFLNVRFSYTTCFNSVFFVFGFFGWIICLLNFSWLS